MLQTIRVRERAITDTIRSVRRTPNPLIDKIYHFLVNNALAFIALYTQLQRNFSLNIEHRNNKKMSDGNRQLGSIPPEVIAVAVNRTMVYLAVLTVTVIFFVASFQPRPILLPAMSSLLTMCAFAAGIFALVRVQPFNAPFLTFWDLAAVWLFLAIGLGLLADPAAIEAYHASVFESPAPTASESVAADAPAPAPEAAASVTPQAPPPAPPATN